MALAVVAAGFTPGQADELRRAIAAWKRQGNRIAQFGELLESGMLARGYSRRFATQVFEQIKGFSGYGFPESHAASFALLVYASAWLKRHHPAAFTAALLNSQPMGFYAPAQIIRDARDHGVAVRAVDIHCSRWDCTLERGIDLAIDLAISLARRTPAHAVANGRGSCRRTQQEIDDGVIRMHARHPHVRHGGAKSVEGWDPARARWTILSVSPEGGSMRHREQHEEAPVGFSRLHSRGRSVAAGVPHPIEHEAEPLCASMQTEESGPAADAEGGFGVASQPAIRLGLRTVRGLDVEDAHRVIEAVVRHGVFASIADLYEASGIPVAALRRLAAADAFASMGIDRQQAMWQILALRDHERPLWSFASDGAPRDGVPADILDTEPALPEVHELSAIAKDFDATGVSLRGHPIACIRPRLARARVVPCSWLRDERRTPVGRILSVAGMVLVRQRPSTAKGIVFMTLEDETGVVNLIFRPKVYERLRLQVRHAAVLCARGKVERRDGVTHLIVSGARDLAATLVEGGSKTPAPAAAEWRPE